MTTLQAFLLPLFLHIGLIVAVGVRSLKARIKSLKNGAVKLDDIATNSSAWPSKVRKFGNNFDSQFDLPMLWYAGCALIVALGFVDLTFVALSWLFLVSRVLHTFIHTGYNNVRHRMLAYLAGVLLIVLMWLWLAIKLYVTGAVP
jgi:hypothetical protein